MFILSITTYLYLFNTNVYVFKKLFYVNRHDPISFYNNNKPVIKQVFPLNFIKSNSYKNYVDMYLIIKTNAHKKNRTKAVF